MGEVWSIEFTDRCYDWIETLDEVKKNRVYGLIELLSQKGNMLRGGYSAELLNASKIIPALLELRLEVQKRKLRILYCFHPVTRKTIVLLLGGDKTNDKRWYEKNIPIAEREWLSL